MPTHTDLLKAYRVAKTLNVNAQNNTHLSMSVSIDTIVQVRVK